MGIISDDKYKATIDSINQLEQDKYLNLLGSKDYSGLTALAEERKMKETFHDAAENIVKEIEDNYPNRLLLSRYNLTFNIMFNLMSEIECANRVQVFNRFKRVKTDVEC